MLIASGNFSFIKDYVEGQMTTGKKIMAGVCNILSGTPGYGIFVRHQLKKCLEGIIAREEIRENKNMTVYELHWNGIKLDWRISDNFYVIKDANGDFTFKRW